MKIDFNTMEKGVLPYVFDVRKRIQKVAKRKKMELEDMHIYDDMRLCITSPEFAKEIKMKNGFDFKIFFEEVLEEVLYWHAYYEKYWREPWEGLSHGEEGKREAVKKYNVGGNRKNRRRTLSKKRK